MGIKKLLEDQLEYRNNWEADEYYVDGQLIEDMKYVFIDDAKYEVKSRRVSVPYHDMGHEYSGVSKHYFLRREVFGIDMEFDLNRIVDKVPVIVFHTGLKLAKPDTRGSNDY